MANFYITGYRNYELGLFGDNDPKTKYLKKYLQKQMLELIDSGVEWFLFSGQSGIEYLAFQVVNDLKAEYDIKTGVLFPFADFGMQSERSQQMIATYKSQSDYYADVTKQPYQNPRQLKYHTQFVLAHTQGTWMLYDNFEQKGKTEYFYQDALAYQEQHPAYEIIMQTFDDVNQSLQEF